MALQRQHYIIALTTPEGVVEHDVEITPADQLRAEVEGRRHGVQPSETPVAYTVVCMHRALIRLGLYAEGYQEFVNRDLYEWKPVEGSERDVDPTTSAAPSPSDSPSLSGLEEAPATGSTPS